MAARADEAVGAQGGSGRASPRGAGVLAREQHLCAVGESDRRASTYCPITWPVTGLAGFSGEHRFAARGSGKNPPYVSRSITGKNGLDRKSVV